MYTEQQFSIPKLSGLSEKTIEEHKKLYAGYVKHANLIHELLEKGVWEGDGGTYTKSELLRRFSFEFSGMRNHECYFKLLEGAHAPDHEGALVKALELEWKTLDAWKARFTAIALTRGIGWAMLYWDPIGKKLVHGWVDEQHIGQLAGCQLVIALDMWEHSFVADYFPSGKKQYVTDFLNQMNWRQAEANFVAAKGNA